MDAIFDKLPDWAGTIPQWGVFVLLLIAVVRTSPQWLQTFVTASRERKDRLANRIKELEGQVRECERKCDEREGHFKDEIDTLKTRLNNEAWQRVQSEISLVNTLLQVVPAPELKIILEALQRRSATLPAAITAIGGPIEDTGSGAK